ncbi:MAG TPA: hypothetical protein VJ747_10135 [Stellaceae bacterium]|nr:hypothetical protein [Stellaceae bacterium]
MAAPSETQLAILVRMPVMDVWVVRVPVDDRGVPMDMDVRLAGRVAGRMPVAVMLVVHVRMLMHHAFVGMLMLVMFHEMQVEADAHQERCGKQLCCYRLTEAGDGERRPDERSREVGARPGGAEVPASRQFPQGSVAPQVAAGPAVHPV